MLEKIVKFFSPKHLRSSENLSVELLEEKRKANTTIYFILTGAILIAIMFTTRFYLEGMESSKSLLLLPAFSITLILSLFISRFRKNLYFASYVIVAACLSILFIRVPATGGITSPVAVWYTILPIVATVMISKKVGMFTAILASALLLILSMSEKFGIQVSSIKPSSLVSGIVLIIVVIFLSSLIYFYELERQNNQKKIIKYQKDLAHTKRLASLGNVSSGLAHEMNNPLTVVRGNVDILQTLNSMGKMNEEKLTKHLGMIERNLLRVESIISAFRTYSSQEHLSDFERLTVSEVIKNTIEADQYESENFKIEITGNIEQQLEGNQNLLKKVFQSLMHNSFYELKEIKDSKLVFDIKDTGNSTVITATDTGHGIPADVAEKIFDPFFTTKDVGEGSGMGLSLAFNIISLHGGKLFYNSSSAKTQFIIELPHSKV